MIALSEKPNMTNGSPAESATEKRTADAGTALELQGAATCFLYPYRLQMHACVFSMRGLLQACAAIPVRCDVPMTTLRHTLVQVRQQPAAVSGMQRLGNALSCCSGITAEIGCHFLTNRHTVLAVDRGRAG